MARRRPWARLLHQRGEPSHGRRASPQSAHGPADGERPRPERRPLPPPPRAAARGSRPAASAG
eukprot:11587604-Alexandrium_andersonii.AAC.1